MTLKKAASALDPRKMAARTGEESMKIAVCLCWVSLMWAPVAYGQSIHVVTETATTTIVVNGKVTGAPAEVVRLTLKTAGLDHEVDILPWARAYQQALREPYTLIFPLARTREREAQFKWVGELAKVNYYFAKRADRKDINIRQLADAKHYTVGVLRDDVRHRYLEQAGFSKLVVAARWNDNLARVINREIDLVVLAEFDLAAACAELSLDCAVLENAFRIDALGTGLYMAYSLSTPDAVMHKTKVAFDKLKAEGRVDRMLTGRP
jgi:polar amino acid transport system substrate-binding protein